MGAFQLRYPPTKRPTLVKIVSSQQPKDGNTVFTASFIPPLACLSDWKSNLKNSGQNEKAGSVKYIECSFGRCEKKWYDMEALNQLSQVYRLKEMGQAVEQEINWFAEPFDTPKSVESHPSEKSVARFQELIYTSPYNQDIKGYDVAPDQLAKLCCTRWLSSDHMYWMAVKINDAQKETFCVYLNHIGDIKRITQKRIKQCGNPKNIIFLINVGLKDGKTFLGSDALPGSHWTTCHVDNTTKVLTYGDSLGWPMPEQLTQNIGVFVEAFWDNSILDYQTNCCHDATSKTSAGNHICVNNCAPLFPLQKCSSVCGVVSLVMAAVSCFAYPLYLDLITKQATNDLKQRPFSVQHLTNPTQYSVYLRHVLMAWSAEKEVDIRFVLPSGSKDQSNFSTATPINPDSITSQKTSKLTENPETAPITQDNYQTTCPTDSTLPPTEAAATTEADKTKEQDDNQTLPPACNTKADEAQKNANGVDGLVAKNKKVFKCSECKETFSKLFNFKRHMKRKHPTRTTIATEVEESKKGNCTCLHCSFQCYRIRELRQHLSQCHSVIFKSETKEFESYAGKN